MEQNLLQSLQSISRHLLTTYIAEFLIVYLGFLSIFIFFQFYP